MQNTTLPLAFQSLSSKVVPMTVYRVLDYDDELIQKVRSIQIELLQKLVSVCKENGLHPFLIYGSLLGCVRDGGFIPGDDDIDIALMRDDYDKLMSLTDAFDNEYFLQTPLNDDCFYGGYAKLRKNGTTCIIPGNWYKNCNEGIFIDIFPVDFAYSDKAKEQHKLRRIRLLQRLLYAKSYGFFRNFKDMPLLVWKAYKYAGILKTREQLISAFDNTVKSHDDSSKCCIYTHYLGQGEIVPTISRDFSFSAELVRDFQKVDFEGVEIDIPCGWKELLIKRYGSNFLEMSGAANMIKKRHGFYSVDTSYDIYKKRFSKGSHNDWEGHKFILVGDNAGISEFHKQFGTEPKPAAILITHDVAWPLPDYFSDVLHISLSDLEKADFSECRIVIAGIYFREVEVLLNKQGILRYTIFVRNREWIKLANPEAALCELRDRNI